LLPGALISTCRDAQARVAAAEKAAADEKAEEEAARREEQRRLEVEQKKTLICIYRRGRGASLPVERGPRCDDDYYYR
jgi:hypothetical protein